MTTRQPNILFLLVDELRYPMHFPPNVISPGDFMRLYMPHTYELLWTPGVRFNRAFTAASDCTPARGTIVTGLYAQQTFCMTTRANPNQPQGDTTPQPPLSDAFPTYGKLLRREGYDTPYIGKWHLSDAGDDPWLENYGFDGMTLPDPVSLPGQGWGSTPAAKDRPMPFGDPQIANQAVSWMQQRDPNGKPFCLTVGFSNPHDKQYFWGGIEVSRFNGIYAAAGREPMLGYTTDIVHQANPPDFGYRFPPENWTTISQQQMTLHKVFREFFARAVGDSAQDPSVTQFTTRPSFNTGEDTIVAVAPWAYWMKGLNMYIQAMKDVDEQIAQVVANIPPALRDDTVVVFLSDHGEYAGSHGLQGKGFTAYEETMHVPLVFTDLTGDRRYTSGNLDRDQFASSVDILPFFLNLAHGGNGWMEADDVRGLYEGRNDLLAVIQANAPVIRDYIAFTCDEVMTTADNYLGAPEHVLAYRDANGKVGVYSHWTEGQAAPLASGQEREYYDYTEPAGYLELTNNPVAGTQSTQRLLDVILPQEIQKAMPNAALKAAQQKALEAYWLYVKLADSIPSEQRAAQML